MIEQESNKLVSIVMPCYNGAEHLIEAINSVVGQSYSNWELIIVDDHSSDNSKDIIKSYNDKRIKYLLNTNAKGVSGARNCAICFSKGKYICFLDCDDFWSPNKLSKQVYALVNSDCHICHTSYNRVDNDGKKVNEVTVSGVLTYYRMLKGNQIGNLTGMYDCEFLGKVYQRDIGHEDYLMWLELMKNSSSIAVEENLASYRVSNTSLSSNKLQTVKWHFKILNRNLGLSVFKSSFYLLCYILNALQKRF